MIISWLSTFNYGNIKKSRLIQSLRKIQSIPILNRQRKHITQVSWSRIYCKFDINHHSSLSKINIIIVIFFFDDRLSKMVLANGEAIFPPKSCRLPSKTFLPKALFISSRCLHQSYLFQKVMA